MARLVKFNATGPVKVEPSDKPIFVCACGLSRKFPFCDGTHKTCRDEAEGKTFVYDENLQRREAEGR
jgi:CDGSH-type Zn-finger protein